MKAISVKQPWANMIASGEKSIETRTWKTSPRGPLLIVSSKTPAIAPAGQAVAIVVLIECRPMSVLDEPDACCPEYDGAFSWVFEIIRRIDPFPVVGQPGFIDVSLPEELKQGSDS